MPLNSTFNDNWLTIPDVKDKNADSVSVWCQRVKNDNSSAHCVACSKSFSIANMGFAQIEDAHADGKKHKAIVGCTRGQTFFKVHKTSTPENIEITVPRLAY